MELAANGRGLFSSIRHVLAPLVAMLVVSHTVSAQSGSDIPQAGIDVSDSPPGYWLEDAMIGVQTDGDELISEYFDSLGLSTLATAEELSPYASAPGLEVAAEHTIWQKIAEDHIHFYDWHSLRMLGGGFLAAAAVANTQLDRQIQTDFQASVRGATSDEWFEFLHANKELGNGHYTLPVFAGAWLAGELFDESPVLVKTSEWGERSLRSFLVGAPPMILAQKLTGGSRPTERGPDSSHWRPWADNNGVSGHAFMSSLPFINAAKMTQNRWLKTTFYAGSLLGPLSRVNDDAHFTSQVALGWWMAYVSATAIDRTQFGDGHLQIYPYASTNGYGAMFEVNF